MKERPVLFSGSMVRAILSGSKSQTRRVVKHKWPHLWQEPWYATGRVLDDLSTQPGAFMEFRHRSQDEAGFSGSPASTLVPCPYGQPGDRLWVREAWQYADWTEEGEPYIGYAAGGDLRLCANSPIEWADRLTDTWEDLSKPANYDIDGRAADRKWRPSIHMPRWACRLVLEIVSVRVERLQDISEQDAEAEGVERTVVGNAWRRYADADLEEVGIPPCASATDSFKSLWQHINGADSWAANPWVWCITFRRVS